MSQTLVEVGVSLKAAKQLSIWMLAWMGRMLQQWGFEGWLRGVVNCKLRKKSIKVLQCDTRMLLGVALERWGRKTQWLAERNGFEMQLFQTKSQLAGAHKGIESIQPMIMEAERKSRLELGIQKVVLRTLFLQSKVRKADAMAHWRERVSSRGFVAKLISQMVQDEVVEHGLRHMFRSWQEMTAVELDAQTIHSPGPIVPQDWIDGIMKMTNLGWVKSSRSQQEDEAKLRVAAQHYASKKQEFLEALPANVKTSQEFLASSENCALVLELQKEITAQREVLI